MDRQQNQQQQKSKQEQKIKQKQKGQKQEESQNNKKAQSNENNQQQWESFEQEEASGNAQLQAILQQAIGNIQRATSNVQPQIQAQEEQQQWEEEEEEEEEQQQKKQGNNQPQSTLGCQHYLRNCEVEAPCCKIFYTCKLCHDEKYAGIKSPGCKVERMAFDQVKAIKCLKCQKVQQPSVKCTNPQCEITFGKYSCLKCMLYQNKKDKVDDIFHCDQCGMCRRGKKQRFFHCKVCGYCRHISEKGKHKCTQNLAESKCPICLEVLKFSVKHYTKMACGHLIHLQCQAQYNALNCPVCGMATQKLPDHVNKQIQQQIQLTRQHMPPELKDKKVNILCNQCLHKSYDVPFHFLGIKCGACGTYNTKMI